LAISVVIGTIMIVVIIDGIIWIIEIAAVRCFNCIWLRKNRKATMLMIIMISVCFQMAKCFVSLTYELF